MSTTPSPAATTTEATKRTTTDRKLRKSWTTTLTEQSGNRLEYWVERRQAGFVTFVR